MVKVKYLKCAFVLIVMAILLAGCSLMEDGGDEPVVTSTINFYPEEYEEEFSQYKQEMNVGKENKKLIVKSIVSAGSMEVDVYNPDGDHVKTIFAENDVEEAIDYGNNYGGWKFMTTINEDTYGSITIELY